MDDHSVKGYLQRLSSAELEEFLWQCACLHGWDSYAHVIPQILEILQARGHRVSTPILRSWEAYFGKR